MKVITLLNQKGGVGKTTLGICLAARWHLAGERVAIIDADPQKSAIRWKDSQNQQSTLAGITVLEAESPSDLQDVRNLRSYDRVVIDTPGTDKLVSRMALNVADAALIPVKPSAFDVSASYASVSLAKTVGVRTAYVVTQIIHQSDLGREAMTALARSGIGLIRKGMGLYTGYVRAIGNGESPQTLFPGSPAAHNIEAVGQAIETEFGWR